MARPAAQPATQKVSDVIQTFQPTRRFNTNTPCSITSIDFDDTGELCLVAQDDETIQIYNCKEGKHAKELRSQKYGVDCARFTHHPQSIIYASTRGDDAIRYLSTHDNSYIRYFRGHTAPVTSITLSPSSDEFMSSSLDNTVRLWELRSQNARGILNLTTPYLSIFDPTASVLAIACIAARSILLYDMRNFDKPPFAEFTLDETEKALGSHAEVQRHGGIGKWTRLEFSNDGRRLLVATGGAGHFILDAFEGECQAYLLRPQGGTGRVAPADIGPLRALQQATQAQGKRPGSVAPSSGQGDACFSPCGRYVIGGSGEGDVLVWDLGRAEPDDDKILRPVRELAQGSKLGVHNKVVSYNPRHNQLAMADRALVFWLPEPDG